jgi:hypothetical protein
VRPARPIAVEVSVSCIESFQVVSSKDNFMGNRASPVDINAAEDHLMRFLVIEGLFGQEKAIGAGQYEVHTVKEYVHLPEFAIGCRLAVALATLEW